MSECVFCDGMKEHRPEFFLEDESGLFVAMWDMFPVTPGHALVIPKRHIQHFRDMNSQELARIATVVAQVKDHIIQTNIRELYGSLTPPTDKSAAYIEQALTVLDKVSGAQPDAFNDGINDGPAAGQTVPHLHWHVMPRWHGDVDDPRGGIRHMFAGKGNYHK